MNDDNETISVYLTYIEGQAFRKIIDLMVNEYGLPIEYMDRLQPVFAGVYHLFYGYDVISILESLLEEELFADESNQTRSAVRRVAKKFIAQEELAMRMIRLRCAELQTFTVKEAAAYKCVSVKIVNAAIKDGTLALRHPCVLQEKDLPEGDLPKGLGITIQSLREWHPSVETS